MLKVQTGGCLCKEVRFKVNGPLRGVVNCHCSMCRKLMGCYGAHTKARNEHIEITKSDGLKWYSCDDGIALRGFCSQCGSTIFWKPENQEATGIVAGCMDNIDHLETIGHIFVADKAQFYEIADNLPQFSGSSNGQLPDDTLKKSE